MNILLIEKFTDTKPLVFSFRILSPQGEIILNIESNQFIWHTLFTLDVMGVVMSNAVTEGHSERHGIGNGLLPARWWQWLLVYPTLAISLLGSIPTIIEAYSSFEISVPFGTSKESREQNSLYDRNSECLISAQFKSIVTPSNVEVGSIVCSSGDVLLRAKKPDWNTHRMRWVSFERLLQDKNGGKEKTSFLSLIGTSYAASLGVDLKENRADFRQVQYRIICQRWIGNGILAQRLMSNGACYDQVVNTYTGVVLSFNPAPCSC